MIIVGKILYYFIYIICLYLYLRYLYANKNSDEKRKIKLFMMIIFAALFGIYAMYCGSNGTWGDRYNYAMRFENDVFKASVKSSSLGLFYLEEILHLVTHDSKWLFFFVSAIFTYYTLYLYQKEKDMTPEVILLLFLSTYGLISFYMLKQALAVVFASCSMVLFYKKQKIKSLVFLIIALLFHETAIIVPVIYFMIYFTKKGNYLRFFSYIILLVFCLFFNKINTYIISIFNLIPSVNIQLSGYLDSEGSLILNYNYLTALKGLPFYLITFLGIVYRKKLSGKIERYNDYLTISFLCSIFTLLSTYMYWMWRFSLYCYLYTFVLYIKIYSNCEVKFNQKIMGLVIPTILLALILKLLLQYFLIYGGIG